MAHAQKPDFVFRRNGRVHLNRRGASVQSTVGSRGVRISVSNAGYTTFRGSVRVLATRSICQFRLHFPSHASPCAIRFQTHSNNYCFSTARMFAQTPLIVTFYYIACLIKYLCIVQIIFVSDTTVLDVDTFRRAENAS